jgi:hypothetical protein
VTQWETVRETVNICKIKTVTQGPSPVTGWETVRETVRETTRENPAPLARKVQNLENSDFA